MKRRQTCVRYVRQPVYSYAFYIREGIWPKMSLIRDGFAFKPRGASSTKRGITKQHHGGNLSALPQQGLSKQHFLAYTPQMLSENNIFSKPRVSNKHNWSYNQQDYSPNLTSPLNHIIQRNIQHTQHLISQTNKITRSLKKHHNYKIHS